MIHHILNSLKKGTEGTPFALLNPFFGPIIPNHTHPASTVESRLSMSDDDIPENILVFNCITSLLAHLPRSKPIEAGENLAWSKSSETQDELKISGAFARLAVSQHGTVAVSTERGRDLHLMICATRDAIETHEDSDYCHFLITGNNRSTGSSTFSGPSKPIIVTPLEPDNLNGQTAYDYTTSLLKDW